MCLLATASWATVITFDAPVDHGDYGGSAGPFTVVKEAEGVTVTLAVTRGMATDAHYRVYKNETMTISANGGDISKIVLTCVANGDAQYGPGCFNTDVPTYGYDGPIGTWEGASAAVVFTAATNQVRMTKVEVTVGAAGVAAPRISPEAGKYYEPIKVSMTCPTPDAKIYYTTDGSTPSKNSTQYTAPFDLNTNATVKAIAIKGDDLSNVSEAAYEFVNSVDVANIEEYAGKADGTGVKFKNPVYAVAQNGKYLYVKDNSGYALFYGDLEPTYQLGDVIPAGFFGTKTTYAGEPELMDLVGFKPASGKEEFEPEPITTAMVNHDHWAHYVYFESATIDPDAKILTDAAGTAPVYFSMGVSASQVTAGVEYEVWAVIGSYKPKDGDVVYQILPIKVKRKGPGGVGIGNMGDYADGMTLTFDYDATVIYHGNQRLFVKDDTGFGLIYGDPGKTYKQGDVFPAGYSGQKTTYGGEPELQKTFSGFENPIKTVTVEAEVATPLDANHEHFAHYVVMKNVDVIELSGNNFKVRDANGNICAGYNQFGQDIQEGHYDELYGIIGSYGSTNTVYQLLPLIPSKPTPVKNINELYALSKGKQGQFTTALTAIYHHPDSRYLYIQDVDGTQTLVYGGVSGTFSNGDLINNAVATWNEYQGAKQMIPVENFVADGHGNEIMPDDPLPIEEISQDMVHRYLSFVDVDLVEEDEKIYIVDETDRLHMFNKFGIEIKGNAPYYIEGFLTIYNGEFEFYPIKIEGEGGDCGFKGDVNDDKEIGIADVNALIDVILGAKVDDCTRWRADVNSDNEINVADVNAVIDVILR